MIVRLLGQADYPALERLLAGHAETSMFLRSNARRAGLDYAGGPLQGRYLGVFDDEALQGVLALFWNGMLIAQAPATEVMDTLLDAARGAWPDAELSGLNGEGAQMRRAAERLGLLPEDFQLFEVEPLFSLGLDALRVPAPLLDGRLAWRHADAGDVPRLTAWRTAYDIETLGGVRGEMKDNPTAFVADWIARSAPFVLMAGGEPVAMAAWNAELPDMVQIGGVFTPPEQRGRGYGRAVVAAALITARDRGASQAILFTHTPAAERAYRALGFERIGEYLIAVLSRGVSLGVTEGAS